VMKLRSGANASTFDLILPGLPATPSLNRQSR
jgi:hypothetical protein